MNLEMAVTEEMLSIACRIKPTFCCLVPEKREELTTVGGLVIVGQQEKITAAVQRLSEHGIATSLFIDADKQQIDAAVTTGKLISELHTGHYAEATADRTRSQVL